MAAPFQLSGSLEEIPLPDIARLFQSTRKTGRLSFISGHSSGFLFFDQGDIIDCQSTNMSGLDALKHAALFNRGTFDFADGALPASQTLHNYETSDLINILESRMQESRQLQELMPEEGDIPRYMGGTIPAGLEVGAGDLAIALKAAAGNLSVRRLTIELSLDETMVRYTIARFRAAGLMEIVGRDEVIPNLPAPALAPQHQPKSTAKVTPRVTKTTGIAGAPPGPPSTQPRYWRGRRLD